MPEIKNFPISDNSTLGDIARIKTNIATLRKALGNKGLNTDFIDHIPLRFAVAKNREDMFLFYLRKWQSSKEKTNIYQNTHQVEVANFYDVTVEKTADSKWCITKIISLY